MAFRPLLAQLEERADRGRRGVKDRDAVLVDHRPQAIGLGMGRRALVHHHRRAVRQRSVDDVAVAGDPSDIGGAPVRVVVFEVEHPLARDVCAEEIPSGGMHDALGLAGGPAGVEDEQRVLGVEVFRLAPHRGVLHHVVPPHVATRFHRHRRAAPPTDHDLLDRGTVVERTVDLFLECHRCALAESPIGGDDQGRLRVVDAVLERFRRKAAEHHAVRRADPGAGQHGDRQLGDHRHVDRDPVAFLNTEALEHARELADFAVEVLVGEGPRITWLAFPDDRGFIAPPGVEVAVQAIDRHVRLAADEPLGEREFPIEDLLPLLKPEQLFGQVPPELVRVPLRLFGELGVVLHALDVRGPAESRLGLEHPTLGQYRLDLWLRHSEQSPSRRGMPMKTVGSRKCPRLVALRPPL